MSDHITLPLNHFQQQLNQQDFPAGALYIVATPIGNMADITFRAHHILENVDGIACEDTRHTSILLRQLGINKPLLALHEHNERAMAEKLVGYLQSGQRWAYVSDAGTPGISDPGSRLVEVCTHNGVRSIPIPGASAVSAIISASGKGMNTSEGKFQFLGFLPMKAKARDLTMLQIDIASMATIIYEAPQRIATTLNALHSSISDKDREIVIGRELTKKFETISRISIKEIPEWIATQTESRGEFVLLIEGVSKTVEVSEHGEFELAALSRVLSKHIGSKQIAEVISEITTMSKKDAYQLVLDTKKPE